MSVKRVAANGPTVSSDRAALLARLRRLDPAARAAVVADCWAAAGKAVERDGTTVRIAGVDGERRLSTVDNPLALSTTSFVARDETAAVERHAAALDLDLRVTNPGFDRSHPATAAYLDGEAKEGVGMGGALALADDAGVLDAVAALTDRLVSRRAGTEAGP